MSLARLFLSPHLDDVVFSCGGTVAAAVAGGERSRVVTLCSEGPQGSELGEVARALHLRWGATLEAELNGVEFAKLRRGEDEQALKSLGVESEYLGLRDCIYRRRGSGGWRIQSDVEVFEGMKRHDQGICEELVAALRSLEGVNDATRIHAPLAIGGHVDHELCRRAAELWRPQQLQYYEDFPYCLQPGRLEDALGDPSRWRAEIERLPAFALEARIEAASCYRSQLPFLFGDAQTLATRVREYAASLLPDEPTWAERHWHAANPEHPVLLTPSARGHAAVGGHGLAGTRRLTGP